MESESQLSLDQKMEVIDQPQELNIEMPARQLEKTLAVTLKKRAN